jgi:hypothetical protein
VFLLVDLKVSVQVDWLQVEGLYESRSNLLIFQTADKAGDLVTHAFRSPAGAGSYRKIMNIGDVVGARPCWRAGVAFMFRCSRLGEWILEGQYRRVRYAHYFSHQSSPSSS